MEFSADHQGKKKLSIGVLEIVLILGVLGISFAGTNIVTGKVSSGVSEKTSTDIQILIKKSVQELHELEDTTMTMEEAEIWRVEQDKADYIDDTIEKHGKDIVRVEGKVDAVLSNQSTASEILEKLDIRLDEAAAERAANQN